MDNYNLLPCGVLIISSSYKVSYCNSLFASQLSLSIDDIVNHPIDNFLSNGSKIIFQQIVIPTLLNQNKVDEVMLNFLNPNKIKIPVVMLGNLDQNDNIILCCFSAKERNKLVDSLHESKRKLEETNSKLKILAKTDELTGCYNRREMQLKMTMIRRQMVRRKSMFAILMLDLDDFKQINEAYGHGEGDHVLKQFANILKYNARFDDVVARYGGEEFLIILPEIELNDAISATDRIHDKMKEISSKAKKVTVSIGICIVAHDNLSNDDELIMEADKALFISKNTGKNKTTLSTLTPIIKNQNKIKSK